MAWPPQDNTSGGDEVKSAAVPNLRRCRSSSGYNFALSETSPSDHAIAATAGSSHVLSRCAGCRDLSLSCRKPDRGGRSWTILEAPLAGYPGNRMPSGRRRAETVISFLQARDAIAPERPFCARSSHSSFGEVSSSSRRECASSLSRCGAKGLGEAMRSAHQIGASKG
jgi:hypothetical protein